MVLNEGKRLMVGATDQVRPIWTEVDVLPAAHGSAISTRRNASTGCRPFDLKSINY